MWRSSPKAICSLERFTLPLTTGLITLTRVEKDFYDRTKRR